MSTSRRAVAQQPRLAQPDDQAVVRFRNPVDAVGDTAAPNVVLEDSRLSAQLRFTYIVLRKLAYQRQGQPIYRRDIARHTGVSVRQIARHLAELEEARLVQIDSGQHDGLPNCYWIEDLGVRYGDLGGPPRCPHRTPPPGLPAGSAPRDADVPPPKDAGVPPRGTLASDNKEPAVVEENQQQHLRNDPATVARLVAVGVAADVAASLVAVHPAEAIDGVLDVLRKRRPRPRDPAAWAVAAIRRGWALPTAKQTATPKQPAPPIEPPPEEALLVAFEQRADAAIANLSPEERHDLQQQATDIVQERFDQRTVESTIGLGLIQTEMRLLIAGRTGIPVPTPLARQGGATSATSGPV